MDKKAFAECMKRNREKQNISFEILSERTDIPVGKLIEFESGEFDRITASELENIGKAIKVPPVALMQGGGTAHHLHRPEDGNSYCEWVDY